MHHGIWDNDIPCAPILLDVTVDGKRVKAVAQPTKQAFLYVFDRVTGKPIWPIEERPVPQGRRAGRVVLADATDSDEAAGLRPAGRDGRRSDRFHAGAAAEALEIASWHKLGPLFTPPVVSNIDGPLGTLMAPSQDGGIELAGRLVRSRDAILYVASSSTVVSKGLVPPYPGQSDMAYVEGNAVTGARTSGGSGSSAGGGRSEFQGRRPAAAPADPSARCRRKSRSTCGGCRC